MMLIRNLPRKTSMNNYPRALIILIIVVFILGSSLSCAKSEIEEFQPAYWPTEIWEHTIPEEQGMDSAQLVRMFEYIEDNDLHLHSLLIVRNGYVVTEAYCGIHMVQTIDTQSSQLRNRLLEHLSVLPLTVARSKAQNRNLLISSLIVISKI